MQHNDKNPGLVMTIAAIAGGSLAGHLVGRAVRPTIRKALNLQPADPDKGLSDDEFYLGIKPREVMPGVALALLTRNWFANDMLVFFGVSFVGSAFSTVMAGTKVDQQTRQVLKKVAPGGSLLA